MRDEIEHLLNDNGDMAHLYLTIKRIQNQQSEAVSSDAFSNSIAINPPHLRQLGSNRSRSLSSHFFDDHNVEDLDMYCSRLISCNWMEFVTRYYRFANILTIQKTMSISNSTAIRMELIQLQLTLTIASFAISTETLVAGWVGMNIPCALYQKNGIFEIFTGGHTLGCLLIFLLVLEYARWTKLIDA